MARSRGLVAILAVGTLLAAGPSASAQTAEESARETDPPFGGPGNVAYAEDLWMALGQARLVGPDSFHATPYKGQEPHGAILVTMEGTISLQGHEGLAIVKKNHLGDDLTPAQVANDPERHLASITVMYQREAGYDPDHQNWYWAKYLPTGQLDTNPKGMKLGGRVAKGAGQGCIACHKNAPGGDYVFNHDRLVGD